MIAAEVEKHFETKVKPSTIYSKAQRIEKGGTNVPPAATLLNDMGKVCNKVQQPTTEEAVLKIDDRVKTTQNLQT